ncbi:MAG: hypothetical protein Q9181_007054 [Wetmoreana brouardii]
MALAPSLLFYINPFPSSSFPIIIPPPQIQKPLEYPTLSIVQAPQRLASRSTTNMKLLATIIIALTATTALAMPAPEPEIDERGLLEKRQSCKRKLRWRRDQNGICVDTRQANSCNGGAIYTGLCHGTPNYVLCCIQ